MASQQVCVEMMSDRGYVQESISEEEIYFSRDEKRALVKFYDSIDVATASELVSRLNSEEGLSSAVLVYNTIHSQAINKILDTSSNVEFFHSRDLAFNITKHILVPRHTLLSDEEKRELLAKYGCDESKLPKILSSDPVARYYGWPLGSVIRIDRPSEIYFRVLVKG